MKRERSASGYQSLDKIKCQIGPEIPHDPCVLFHRGTAGLQVGRKKKQKAPSVAGGAQKNPCTRYSAHAKPLVHPLKVD